jgi:hypothetical protein
MQRSVIPRGQNCDFSRRVDASRRDSTADRSCSRLEKPSQARLLGRYFTAKRKRLRKVARGLGVHHLANLGGCPAR